MKPRLFLAAVLFLIACTASAGPGFWWQAQPGGGGGGGSPGGDPGELQFNDGAGGFAGSEVTSTGDNALNGNTWSVNNAGHATFPDATFAGGWLEIGFDGTITSLVGAVFGTSVEVGTGGSIHALRQDNSFKLGSVTGDTFGNINTNALSATQVNIAIGGGVAATDWTIASDGSFDTNGSADLDIGATNATTLNLGRVGQTQALLGNGTVAGTFDVTGISTMTGAINANGGVDRSTAAALAIGGTTATTLNLGRTGQTQALLGNVTVAGTLDGLGNAGFINLATTGGIQISAQATSCSWTAQALGTAHPSLPPDAARFRASQCSAGLQITTDDNSPIIFGVGNTTTSTEVFRLAPTAASVTGTLGVTGVTTTAGLTTTAAATFSGVTTDVTTGTNEDFTISPNGTGLIVATKGFRVSGVTTDIDAAANENLRVVSGTGTGILQLGSRNSGIDILDTSDVVRGQIVAQSTQFTMRPQGATIPFRVNNLNGQSSTQVVADFQDNSTSNFAIYGEGAVRYKEGQTALCGSTGCGGAPAGQCNLDPSSSYISIDPNGAACVVTIAETTATTIGPGFKTTIVISATAGAGLVTFPDVANIFDGPTLCTTTGIAENGSMEMIYANKSNDMFVATGCSAN